MGDSVNKAISGLGRCLTFLGMPFFIATTLSSAADAQTDFAAGLAGVDEILIDYVQFDDPKASEKCGLTREKIAAAYKETFVNAPFQAIPAAEAKLPLATVARIKLETVISTHIDEMLGCVSWIAMSAQNHTVVSIPPLTAPRDATAVFWQYRTQAYSGQTSHSAKIADVLRKMSDKLIQQYKLDQPPVMSK